MSGDLPDPPQDTRETLELAKLRADIAKATADRIKAELEAREMRQPWLRPAFVSPIIALILTVVATVVGYVNGFFSSKLESLKNEETVVQAKINALNSDQSTLKNQNRVLNSALENQRAEAKRVSNEAKQWEDRVKVLEPLAAAGRENKKRLLAALAAVQVLPSAASETIQQQSAPARIDFSGKVETIDHSALAGVHVQALENDKIVAFTNTDDDGRYLLSLPRPSDPTLITLGLKLDFRLKGYHVFGHTGVVVSWDHPTTSLVQLVKDNGSRYP